MAEVNQVVALFEVVPGELISVNLTLENESVVVLEEDEIECALAEEVVTRLAEDTYVIIRRGG